MAPGPAEPLLDDVFVQQQSKGQDGFFDPGAELTVLQEWQLKRADELKQKDIAEREAKEEARKKAAQAVDKFNEKRTAAVENRHVTNIEDEERTRERLEQHGMKTWAKVRDLIDEQAAPKRRPVKKTTVVIDEPKKKDKSRFREVLLKLQDKEVNGKLKQETAPQKVVKAEPPKVKAEAPKVKAEAPKPPKTVEQAVPDSADWAKPTIEVPTAEYQNSRDTPVSETPATAGSMRAMDDPFSLIPDLAGIEVPVATIPPIEEAKPAVDEIPPPAGAESPTVAGSSRNGVDSAAEDIRKSQQEISALLESKRAQLARLHAEGRSNGKGSHRNTSNERSAESLLHQVAKPSHAKALGGNLFSPKTTEELEVELTRVEQEVNALEEQEKALAKSLKITTNEQ